MSLKEIKEKFCIFLNDFDRDNFVQVVEFLRFVIAEFDDDSENIFKFLKKKKHSEETRADKGKQNNVDIKMEYSDNNDKQTEEESTESPIKPIGQNICQVCEFSDSRCSNFGPDVCVNCHNFFKRTYPLRDRLECETNGRCNCVGLRIPCRKCRLKKCLSIGMRFKIGRKGRSFRVYNRYPPAPVGAKCIGCEVLDATVRFHYGKLMCAKCAKWYSGCKYDVQKVKRFKCINSDPMFQNKCCELFGAEFNRCSKCRYEKIISAIETKP
uniref:Nuclear receptor n=1 Tax=Brachionus koreanus TaxID=1199090 RepID=A0A221CB68_9BILA|nr:nuclear receptor [Brachionus koreanus]